MGVAGGEIDLTDRAAPATVEERLARVERLLDADLASLGPSVVAASIEELGARIDEVAVRVAAGGRLEAPASSPTNVSDRLDLLDRRLDRLTRLVEAATAPLEDDEPADPALRRIEEAIVGLTVMVQQLGAAAADAAAQHR